MSHFDDHVKDCVPSAMVPLLAQAGIHSYGACLDLTPAGVRGRLLDQGANATDVENFITDMSQMMPKFVDKPLEDEDKPDPWGMSQKQYARFGEAMWSLFNVPKQIYEIMSDSSPKMAKDLNHADAFIQAWESMKARAQEAEADRERLKSQQQEYLAELRGVMESLDLCKTGLPPHIWSSIQGYFIGTERRVRALVEAVPGN